MPLPKGRGCIFVQEEAILTKLKFLKAGLIASAAGALALAAACGDSEPVIQTVVVTQAPVIQTVIVTQAPVVQTVVVKETVEVPVAAAPTQAPTATPVPSTFDLPAPKTPAGNLTWAWGVIGPGPGLNSAQSPEIALSWGITELFFRQSATNPVEPWLATEWTLAPDLSKVTIKFRDGVQFHKGFGEMTAADVAWSLNDTNAAVTPTSIHGQAGDYAPLFKAAVAIDKNTMEIPLTAYDVRFASYFMNQAGDGFGIFSKKAFDEKGADYMKANIIATGPYEVTQWTQQDRVVVKALATHWDKAAQAKEIRMLHVPEAQSRVAMMLTGEADLAPLATKDLIDLAKKGYIVSGTGRSFHLSVPMAGNYWETTHAVTGAALDLSGLFNNNLPWQGNPTNQADLDQAKLVRNALARALDRDTIVKQSYASVATPLYIGSFFPSDPNWNDKWKVPYDPTAAAKMLDDAGYKAAANGIRFSMPLFGQSDNQLFSEASEIVAGEWRKIGIDVQVLHYAYAVFRPTAVRRSNTTPVVMTCRQNNGGAPWDWPRLEEYTSLTRGGFGCHMELPFALETYRLVSKEPDPKKRIEANNKLADYWYDQMLEIGIASVPDAVAYNPKAIKSWNMRPGIFFNVNSPENIVLAR